MVKPKEWNSAAALRLREAAGSAKTVQQAASIVADKLLERVVCPPTDLDAIASKLVGGDE